MKRILTQLGSCSAAAALILVSAGAGASSHREAPNITKMPKVDATDFYMFNSYETGREDYVTILANYIPLQDAYGGPNYFTMDPDALYEINIDSDGDAVEDVTFQFQFNNDLGASGAGITLPINGMDIAIPLRNIGPVTADDDSALNSVESYTLNVVTGGRRSGNSNAVMNTPAGSANFIKPYDNVGGKTFANYEFYAKQYVYEVMLPDCASSARVFVGQRKDPFAVNLGEVFDLVNFDPVNINDNSTRNDLADKNVTTLALEVPKACLTGTGNGTIGGWTTASVKQAQVVNPAPTFEKPSVSGGAWVQVSRLSNPLVNELVIGLPDKNLFNAAEPTQDSALAKYVTNPTLPAILEMLFPTVVTAPINEGRADLQAAFLTGFFGVNQQQIVTPSEMIRLNTKLPVTSAPADQSPLGVAGGDIAGFPNGRRPGDDVVDIALRVMNGALCYPLGLKDSDGNNVQVTGADGKNLCEAADAPTGTLELKDGAPVKATDFNSEFPYLTTPIPGSKLPG